MVQLPTSMSKLLIKGKSSKFGGLIYFFFLVNWGWRIFNTKLWKNLRIITSDDSGLFQNGLIWWFCVSVTAKSFLYLTTIFYVLFSLILTPIYIYIFFVCVWVNSLFFNLVWYTIQIAYITRLDKPRIESLTYTS